MHSMAQENGQSGSFLAPPVLAQIRNEDVAARVRMERSVSQEIREERQDLKDAAEHSLNVIVDLGLDGIVRWVSPSWKEVVGTPIESVQGKPISDQIVLANGEVSPFAGAVESMKENDSRSRIIRFRVKLGTGSAFKTDQEDSAKKPEEESLQDSIDIKEDDTITLEGQGMMVYDRTSKNETHV